MLTLTKSGPRLGVASLFLLASPVSGQSLIPIDVPSSIIAISNNGDVLAGMSFRWTAASGVQQISDGQTWFYARAVSGDGSTVVGHTYSDPVRAFAWTPSGGVIFLGDSSFQLAFGTNDDGTIVVGGSSTRAIRWTASGQQELDDLGMGSMAKAVSGDGSVIAGMVATPSGGSLALWDSSGLRVIGALPGFENTEAVRVSRDGSAVIAWCSHDNDRSIRHSFRWTAPDGIQEIGPLPGDDNCFAQGISGDGGVVVGGSALGFGAVHGFIWTPAGGILDFEEHLRSLGLDLTGWTPELVPWGVNADGRVIVGTGMYQGHERGWMVLLPRCGSADFNHDGDSGTDADIEAFFACLAGNCCPACGSADFNGDGDSGTDADIEAFFRVLGGGSC